jgi:hypothetical protein
MRTKWREFVTFYPDNRTFQTTSKIEFHTELGIDFHPLS